MFGVSHKHRYFRIQVIVSVVVSMGAYLAVKAGLLSPTIGSSAGQSLGVPLFTIGPLLAACVLVYFQSGSLAMRPVIVAAVVLYALLIVWPFVIASNDQAANFEQQQDSYFNVLNLIGFLILGGLVAWLGKLIGIFTLAAFVFSMNSGSSEILLLTPALAALNVTNIYAQWTIALTITLSSFLADR